MNRREFNRRSAAIAAIAGIAGLPMLTVPLPAIAASPGRPARIIKPPRLKPGALIGLVAPSGVMSDAQIEKCVKNLEGQGFKVKTGANIRAADGGYAGSPEQRLEDLHAMFSDREVGAIWAARGGSGASGLLPGLRYDLIRRHPKILVGYSDITALHLAISRHTGLVSFHAQVATSTLTDYAEFHLQSILMAPQPTYTMHMSIENERRAETAPQFRLRTLKEGVAEGRLIGGNLSILAALIGTPYATDLKGALLFLEEVREAPYRVDRMLTQLAQSQDLNKLAGAMLGVFQRGNADAGEASLTLEQVIDRHFAGRRFPAVYGYSFGHIADQMTLPVGVRARLDTKEQTLTLLEPAVV